jgi:hypothetical protein
MGEGKVCCIKSGTTCFPTAAYPCCSGVCGATGKCL